MKFMNVKHIGMAAIAIATLGGATTAHAAGTTAGDVVNNKAVVNYNVGGAPQDFVESSPGGNSGAGANNGGAFSVFVVDRKIDLLVVGTEGVGAIPTATIPVGYGGPGDLTLATDTVYTNNYYLTYTVQNLSNSVQDLALTAVNKTGTDDDGLVDTTDGIVFRYFVEDTTAGVAGFDPTDDELLGTVHLDSMLEDETRTVYVVATTPTAANDGADGQIGSITLVSTVHELDGATSLTDTGGVITAHTGAETHDDTTATATLAGDIDTIFVDAKAVQTPNTTDEAIVEGGGTTDIARNAIHADTSHYTLQGTAIVVKKTSLVVADPFSVSPGVAVHPEGDNNTDAVRIPEATVRYYIEVNNESGTQTAQAVEISDALPTGATTYVANSVAVYQDATAGTATTEPTLASQWVEVTDGAAADANGFTVVTTSNGTEIDSLAVIIGNVPVGTRTIVSFDVIVD